MNCFTRLRCDLAGGHYRHCKIYGDGARVEKIERPEIKGAASQVDATWRLGHNRSPIVRWAAAQIRVHGTFLSRTAIFRRITNVLRKEKLLPIYRVATWEAP